MHGTPCPGRTSASGPKLKKELVQRAEIEAMTCFGARPASQEYYRKIPGNYSKLQLQFPRFPELIKIAATDFDSFGINSV